MNEETPSAVPPAEPPEPKPPPAPSSASARSIWSLVLGILSLVTGCFLLGIPLGIIASLLGWLELSAIKRGEAPEAGRGLAVAGLVTGILGAGMGFLLAAYCVLMGTLLSIPLLEEIRRGVRILWPWAG